jgi:hypothetical protein
MAATYTPIASITLGANAASVTFSSIPQTYTDLVLQIVAGTNTSVTEPKIVLNGDTGGNYSNTSLSGNGSAASSNRRTNQTGWILDWVGGITTNVSQYNSTTHIQDYSNSTTYKTALTRANSTDYGPDLMAFLWRSTAAITSVQVVPIANNLLAGSTFNLYGILGANA